jgi:hypothetical protein
MNSLVSFGGDTITQVQHFPSDQTTAPSETQLINMKNALLRGFLPLHRIHTLSTLTHGEFNYILRAGRCYYRIQHNFGFRNG